jgi:imidazoleglycerol phosphate dehydratase HisB
MAENTSVISEAAFKIFSPDVRDSISTQSEKLVPSTKITDYGNM